MSTYLIIIEWGCFRSNRTKQWRRRWCRWTHYVIANIESLFLASLLSILYWCEPLLDSTLYVLNGFYSSRRRLLHCPLISQLVAGLLDSNIIVFTAFPCKDSRFLGFEIPQRRWSTWSIDATMAVLWKVTYSPFLVSCVLSSPAPFT